MKRKITIHDVAKKAELSVSTVSLIMNNKPNVNEETRRKVLEIIRQLGYHPLRSARGLASQSSGNIGFILTEDHFSQAEPFYTKIFLGTEFEARNHNFYILLTTVGWTLKDQSQVPRFLLEHNVDGVIIAGKIGSSWVEYIQEQNLPLILIDYELARHRVSTIGMDNRTGINLVVEHFRTGGHSKIGFIGGDIRHPSIAERFASYRDTLASAGMPINSRWISVGEANTSLDDGYEAAKRIFSLGGERPTAIACANDAMALGCMKFLKEAGIAIPGDVAVSGFDNIEAGLHVEPRLTTVNVHREEMGGIAVRRLVEMIKDHSSVITKTLTPVELIVRDSCGVKESVSD
ncbi:MAG: LacI family DNA-binding transcriptional regulator [Bacteroidota bacterium]|nr:LacI family DNA-binding transcriptional regulator [Bacteroidota bacterium]